MDRDRLNDRIAKRVDGMLAAGAVEEVRSVLDTHGRDCPAMKAIGAPEIAAHITDHISLDDTRERLVIATRRYAKRQRTWFRGNMRDWTSIAPG
jgi:tRNA dimethylallyltransferase